ncbi:MAG: extracellular solute-binding protein [Gammaproteobacteria bacterium]
MAILCAVVLALAPALASASPQDRTVAVLYAGSLAAVMENGLGPAFVKATGYAYQGEAQGSLGAAQMIRGRLRTPDVFISADPAVNESLLMGPQNAGMVKWFMILASAQLVLGYNPRSKFAPTFRAAAAHRIPWYEVLKTPGVRFGRGDPSIDPKGYRTLFMFGLAGQHYHRPELPGLLGDPRNPAQVFPEIVLMVQVESGQCDAGVFYKHEVLAYKLPYISLPPEISLGNPRFAARYARQIYTTSSGLEISGSPILFTITIPETVRHREAALAFVRFLLSSDDLLKRFGLGNVDHQVGGDVTQVPDGLREFASGTFKS